MAESVTLHTLLDSLHTIVTLLTSLHTIVSRLLSIIRPIQTERDVKGTDTSDPHLLLRSVGRLGSSTWPLRSDKHGR